MIDAALRALTLAAMACGPASGRGCPSTAAAGRRRGRRNTRHSMLRAQALRDALARIPVRRRRPTTLLLQGFSAAEIARLLDTTEAPARSIAYRDVDDLKALLAGAVLPENPDDRG